MRREGLTVDSQTLYDQIEALARVLWPAYDRLGAELLEEPVVFADETPWPLLGKNVSSAKWHAWTIASPKGAYYEIHDTRGLDAGKSLLGGFKGITITDGYGVYNALDKRMKGLRIAQCWAHIRRKFVDCESAFPKETEQIIALIRELYAIEDRAPPGRDGNAVRQQLRMTESRCVLALVELHTHETSDERKTVRSPRIFLPPASIARDSCGIARGIRGSRQQSFDLRNYGIRRPRAGRPLSSSSPPAERRGAP